MNFGTIGRCGCGSIGERRDQFSGEPICSPCVTQRSGRVITLRDAISTERAVGTLTRDQRQARVRYLRDSGFEVQRLDKLVNEQQQVRVEHVDSDGDWRHV